MLTFLSYLYKLIWIIRKWMYDKGIFKIKQLPSPVICVGNITAGGTGKTPTVMYIAKLLQEKRYRPVVLTRGYKRRSNAPVLPVSDGHKILTTPGESGDEPYLMALGLKNIPVIVGADRYRSGRFAIEKFGNNLFILDDGFQHLKLYRDINILLIDASNPFGNGAMLPAGILREPLTGISRADCIIISRANEGDKAKVEDAIRSYNKQSPVFHSTLMITGISDSSGETYSPDYIKGKRALIFSGIGNPDSFKRSVDEMGGIIKNEIRFNDHHWYDIKDMEQISAQARDISADVIITTEKDMVRITDSGLLKGDFFNKHLLTLKVEIKINKKFDEWILKRVMSNG
ncbi:MAG: tetraacyldisaccharide 4'-kinase [Nitrospira sp.]|nr:tetraacyldisaccharide 4'-kinase [Nitrospira sp.]